MTNPELLDERENTPGEPARAGRPELPRWAKRVMFFVGAMVIAGAIAWFVDHDRRGRFIQETNNAYVKADQVVISSKLAGFVNAVPASNNQLVGIGDPLIVIDPTDYDSRIAAAEADIRSAIASARATQASAREAEAGVNQAEAALRAVEADLAFVNREMVRYEPLVRTGAEPASHLSRLRAERDKAKAQIAVQRAVLSGARRRVASIGAQADQSLVAADAARIQRHAASNDLARTRLTSPMAGRVANSNVRVGQFILPGVALMTVVPVNDIYVEANFKETQIGLMRPGQKADIQIDAFPGVTLKGKVVSISPGTGANFSLIPPQNATGNFTKIVQRVPVRIRLVGLTPDAQRMLVPGLSAEVTVDTRSARDELDRLRAGAGK